MRLEGREHDRALVLCEPAPRAGEPGAQESLTLVGGHPLEA